MTRILVVWEDAKHEALDLILSRRIAALRGQATVFPQMLFHSVRGDGAFSRYVKDTWKNVRSKGLPANKGAIDHLVCVVDADQISKNVPEVSAWDSESEGLWETKLREACDSSVPSSTIHGATLRWAQESLALAAYDTEAAKEHLQIDLEKPEVAAMISACSPQPSTVENALFTDTFRKPLRCLDELRRTSCNKSVKKNDVPIEDLLKAAAKTDHAKIAERVPDLDRLAAKIWTLTKT
jgi:hypothetical protein